MQQSLAVYRAGLILPRGEFVSVKMPGVHILPCMLTDVQIRQISKIKELRCHHDDGGHGHGDNGHSYSPKEPEEKNKDNSQKTGPRHFRADKPNQLPWVASLIWQHIPDIRIGNLRPCSVDENMQLYRLQKNVGVVPQHVDEDFNGPNQSTALCSILIYLNNGYRGGETVFNGTKPAPQVVVGGGLLFRHDILHEGLPVLSGEKYILKTDLFFGAQ